MAVVFQYERNSFRVTSVYIIWNSRLSVSWARMYAYPDMRVRICRRMRVLVIRYDFLCAVLSSINNIKVINYTKENCALVVAWNKILAGFYIIRFAITKTLIILFIRCNSRQRDSSLALNVVNRKTSSACKSWAFCTYSPCGYQDVNIWV